jgi:IstB-like ATP binding protein
MKWGWYRRIACADWYTIFPNVTRATALIDCIVHHADVISIDGDSYRAREVACRRDVAPTADPVAQSATSATSSVTSILNAAT